METPALATDRCERTVGLGRMHAVHGRTCEVARRRVVRLTRGHDRR